MRHANGGSDRGSLGSCFRYLGLCLQQLRLAYSLVLLLQLKDLLCVLQAHMVYRDY